MQRLQRDVVLIRLIEALRDKGSWCGETHVQKAAYLLQDLVGVPMGFDFILYKHGPYSFDLRDELTGMRADGLVSLKVQDPNYGPSIVPETNAATLKARFTKTLAMHESQIAFVADRLGSKRVVELERLATALFIWKRYAPSADADLLATRVRFWKPHIAIGEASEAARTVARWREEALAVGA